jgi:ABC-type multidrug transport system fused ATPase/permease subunit
MAETKEKRLRKPDKIAKNETMSRKWDELVRSYSLGYSDKPALTLLVHWYAVVDQCMAELTEDGGMLSAGQKQLLCIARVMLSLPPMLILDEATSSIDTRTELLIQEAFGEMMEGRTSFIIAHRLSTVVNADRIIVMNAGKIVEQGTHKELMAKNGAYAELYNSQFEQ